MRLLALGLVFVACLVIVSSLENEESDRAKKPKPSKGKKPKPKPPGGKTKPKPPSKGKGSGATGGKGSGIMGGKGSGGPGGKGSGVPGGKGSGATGGKGSGIPGGKGSGVPGGKGSGLPGGKGSGVPGGKGSGTGMGTQWQKVWQLIQNLRATLMALQQSGAGVPPPKGSGSGMPPPKGSGSGMPPPKGSGSGMPPPKGSGSGMPPPKGTTGAPSGSTSKPVTGEGESEIKIRQTWCQEPAGYDRRAIVRQPAVSGKVPLVICLHGNGGNANLAQWKELWDNNLVVAAEGYERSWNIWKEDSKAPDVEFILDLIKKVGEENPNADMDNVVLVGYSNGAGMIHRLLVETENPRPFHKVFPMASTLIQEQYNGGKFYKSSGAADCEDPNVYDVEVTPASPGPMVFQVHGTEDGAIKYTGGTTFAKFLGAQDTVYYYAKAFGYSGSQLADDAGVATSVDNVFKYSYLDGQVNHYKVVGGTHGDTGKYVWSIVKAIINP